jgi:hypothetical protein
MNTPGARLPNAAPLRKEIVFLTNEQSILRAIKDPNFIKAIEESGLTSNGKSAFYQELKTLLANSATVNPDGAKVVYSAIQKTDDALLKTFLTDVGVDKKLLAAADSSAIKKALADSEKMGVFSVDRIKTISSNLVTDAKDLKNIFSSDVLSTLKNNKIANFSTTIGTGIGCTYLATEAGLSAYNEQVVELTNALNKNALSLADGSVKILQNGSTYKMEIQGNKIYIESVTSDLGVTQNGSILTGTNKVPASERPLKIYSLNEYSISYLDLAGYQALIKVDDTKYCSDYFVSEDYKSIKEKLRTQEAQRIIEQVTKKGTQSDYSIIAVGLIATQYFSAVKPGMTPAEETRIATEIISNSSKLTSLNVSTSAVKDVTLAQVADGIKSINASIDRTKFFCTAKNVYQSAHQS